MKSWRGYFKGKKRRLSEKEPWHMLSLIRYIKKKTISFLFAAFDMRREVLIHGLKQWKADGKTQWLGSYELGNTNWGWSWKERWISARPWEVRYSVTPKKPKSSKTVYSNSNSPAKRTVSLSSVPAKAPYPGARNTVKPRRLSFPGA